MAWAGLLFQAPGLTVLVLACRRERPLTHLDDPLVSVRPARLRSQSRIDISPILIAAGHSKLEAIRRLKRYLRWDGGTAKAQLQALEAVAQPSQNLFGETSDRPQRVIGWYSLVQTHEAQQVGRPHVTPAHPNIPPLAQIK